MAVRYFRYFPEITYNGYAIKDITKLASFKDTVNMSGALYLPYTVREEETAEQVAFFYYGDVSYIWLVYLSNQIIDPYYSWPMKQNQLEDYIQDQYLYACAVCTLKREPETLTLLSDHIDATAEMMYTIARGLQKSDVYFLSPDSEDYNTNYEDIWDWLIANNNNAMTNYIENEYGVENYIAFIETLQEIMDNDFDPNYESARPRLYADLTDEDKLWDINGDGVLDANDISDVEKFATGQYDLIDPAKLSTVRSKIKALSTKWLAYRKGVEAILKPYSNPGEAELFKLGRPMDYTYAYDYLLANIEEGLAEIIIKIPNREELKKTLNVLLWSMDTTITGNIIHYKNIEDPEVVISADTYRLNEVFTSNDWSDFNRDEWAPVRIFDYEFLKNEDRRNIRLIARESAGKIEGILKGIMST
jgi:hypothetical protein